MLANKESFRAALHNLQDGDPVSVLAAQACLLSITSPRIMAGIMEYIYEMASLEEEELDHAGRLTAQ